MSTTDSPCILHNNIVLKASINNFLGLNISLLNTRSMYRKMDEIAHLISGVKLDVLCFVETWLSDYISDAAVYIPGFTIFRKDRKVSDKKWGGGICVYIRSTLTSKLIYKYCDRSLEVIIIEVKSESAVILLMVVYKSRIGEFCDDLETILAEYSLKYNDIIICGDFNCDPNGTEPTSKKFSRLLERFGCLCQNSQPTHFTRTSSNLLDLVITNTQKVIFLNQISVGFSDHDFVFFSYDVDNRRMESSISFRDYKNVDTTSLMRECANLPWDIIYTIYEPNDKVSLLTKWLCQLFEKCIPIKSFLLKSTVPPWFNNQQCY